MQAETIWQLRTELYVYGLKWKLAKTILELVPSHFFNPFSSAVSVYK